MQKLFFLLTCFFALFSLQAQSLTQQWVMRYNGQGDYTDRFVCSALDNNGNIVAAGYSQRNNTGRDILVAKFSPSGSLLWSYTYNGLDSDDDEIHAIALDNVGNIYATGYTKGILTEDDAITLKLDANGAQVWLTTYNFTANQDDEAISITLDQAGNVIVTGKSDSDPLSTSNDDYMTIKYSAAGVQTWVQRYEGIGGDGDEAVKVLTDANNDVYVTGLSDNGTDDDYATLKYTSAGVQVWAKIQDRGANDRPTDMALDANANVYVTGRSNTTTYDFYTVKYTTAGTYTWQNVFNNGDDDRAIAIATTASGESYITGQVANGVTGFYDFATIKINADGTTAWNTLYINANGRDDIPTDIALDASGNIYVCGNADMSATADKLNDAILIKYDGSGTQQWLKNYNGSANKSDVADNMVLDANGNAFLVGYEEDAQTQRNATVLKYDATGAFVWKGEYEGEGDNADNVRDMVRDANGNFYLTGYAFRKGQDRDILTMKLNANGDTLWSRTLNGTSNSTDEGLGLGIDGAGNIIVGGFIKNSGQSYDYFIAKYTPNGDTLFTRTYNAAQSRSDKAAAFALDAAGNIYLTGRSDMGTGLNTNYDMLTLKFTNSGNLAWAKTFNSFSLNEDKAEKIVVDAAGNVTIAGRSWNGTDFDITLVQYNAAGTQQWFTLITGTGEDKPNDLAADANGNIYVTGSVSSATGLDFVTAKYSSTGSQIWKKTLNGASNLDDEAQACVLDAAGNIYITGYSTSSTEKDIYTLKYDAAGNIVWQKDYNASSDLDDIGDLIALDAAGNVFVAAQSEIGVTGNNHDDFVLLAYLPDGTLATSTTYNGTGSGDDVPATILISNNNIYVGGGSWGINAQRDLTLVAYNASGLSAISDGFYTQFNAYPNPATQQIIVENKVSEALHFVAVNTMGQKIALDAQQNHTNWLINVANLPIGAYILFIEKENGQIYTTKFVKE